MAQTFQKPYQIWERQGDIKIGDYSLSQLMQASKSTQKQFKEAYQNLECTTELGEMPETLKKRIDYLAQVLPTSPIWENMVELANLHLLNHQYRCIGEFGASAEVERQIEEARAKKDSLKERLKQQGVNPNTGQGLEKLGAAGGDSFAKIFGTDSGGGMNIALIAGVGLIAYFLL